MTSSFSTADAGPSARIGGTDPMVESCAGVENDFVLLHRMMRTGRRLPGDDPMVESCAGVDRRLSAGADQVVEVDWRTT